MMKKYQCKEPFIWAIQWDGVSLDKLKQALPNYKDDDIHFGGSISDGHLFEAVIHLPTCIWNVEPTDYILVGENDELYCLDKYDFEDMYQEA